jgi:glycosyltransferase involved in cell wall biosynthesis
MDRLMDGDRHGAVLTNRVTSVTLIVPVLNEHAIVPALLEGLAALRPSPQEILICDGGSTDDTGARLEASGCRVLYGERGRARQMNAGARVARSDILVFLHADTRLPTDAVNRVCASLAADGALWGRFDVRIEGRSAMLRVVAAMMNLRSRLSGIATGDQARPPRRRNQLRRLGPPPSRLRCPRQQGQQWSAVGRGGRSRRGGLRIGRF